MTRVTRGSIDPTRMPPALPHLHENRSGHELSQPPLLPPLVFSPFGPEKKEAIMQMKSPPVQSHFPSTRKNGQNDFASENRRGFSPRGLDSLANPHRLWSGRPWHDWTQTDAQPVSATTTTTTAAATSSQLPNAHDHNDHDHHHHHARSGTDDIWTR